MCDSDKFEIRVTSALLRDLSLKDQQKIATLQAVAYVKEVDPVIHDPALRPVSFSLRKGELLVA